MEFITAGLSFFLHLDHHLSELIQQFGAWTYFILFMIIFCETGLVVTPFLPGDSLLFVIGAFCALGSLDIKLTLILLTAAAILGNIVNYKIGQILAPRIFRNEKIPFLKQEYLDRTHAFYEKYGGKTIIITRFAPILRTFAPFLAGMGAMTFGRFMIYNIIGGILWVGGFTLAGYFFGNIPSVKKNFTLVIIAIIVISLLPGLIEYLKIKNAKKQKDRQN